MCPLSQAQLLGLDDNHLTALDRHHRLEHQTAQAWQALQQAAEQAGFKLAIGSSWRSFDRQLAIFNGKAQGERPLLDRNNQPCDVRVMSDADILDAILAWSALPGASRHHWGTDLDWYDANAISPTQLQLIPEEYQANGPCAPLANWLAPRLSEFGFFRPYQQPLGGVSPEPWHISFAPVAEPALIALSAEALEQQLKLAPLALKSSVLTQLPMLIDRYILRISPPA